MSTKAVVITIVVLLVIVGAFAWWQFRAPEELAGTPEPTPTDNTGQSVTANHYFSNGTHTIEGNITLPTPCHELTHDVVVAESAPEQVTINFRAESTAEICTQVLADRFFTLSFQASQDAVIKATLNGVPVALNLIESGEGNLK